MDNDVELKFNNGDLASRGCDSITERRQSLPEKDGADLPRNTSLVTCDLDRAVAALESSENALQDSLSKNDHTDNDLSLQVSNTLNTSTPERGFSSSSIDNEEPLRTRNFNELIAIFSQSNGNEDKSSSKRANSPGLDLTPVKEQACHNGATVFERNERNERSGITDSNDGQSTDNSIVSRMKRNFETDGTMNSTLLEHSQIRKPVTFDISLEDCVTRDCVTQDCLHNIPSVENGHQSISNASSGFSCVADNISMDMMISQMGKYPSTTGNSSGASGITSCTTGSPELFRTISSSTGSPTVSQSNESKNVSSTTGSPTDLFQSFSPTTRNSSKSNISKSISFEINFDDEPMPKSSEPKTSTPTRSKKHGKDISKDPCLDQETDPTKDLSSLKSCSFEISFDDDLTINSPEKSSPNRHNSPKKTSSIRQGKREMKQKSSPDIATPSIGFLGRTESPKLHCTNAVASTKVSPMSLSFEINFDSERSTSPRRSTENSHSETTKSFVTKHELDSLPGKDSLDKELLPTPTIKSEVKGTSVTPLYLQEELLLENKTDEVKTSSPSQTELHGIQADTPKSYTQHAENAQSETENISTTRGISFDISFDDDSPNSKRKLAPNRIRLKLTKAKQQRSPRAQKQSDDVTLRPGSTTISVVKSGEKKPDRDTYTLDEVSKTLQNACETGLTLEQALDNLSKSHDFTNGEHLKTRDHDTVKRGTYSLDQVSDCLVDAADKGLSVEEALDCLANSQETNKQSQGNVESSPKRGTYDLDDVSREIDSKKEKGKSLEEALEQLLVEVESVVRSPQTTTAKRGTYDLERVSQAVQLHSDHGVPVEDSLNKIAVSTENSSGLNTTPQELSSSMGTSEVSSKFSEVKEHDLEKRGTYSLDEVAERLESASEKGNSVTETLRNISDSKAKDDMEQIETSRNDASRNTYTLDEVAQSLEIAKSKGIPIVQALSNITTGSSSEDLSVPGSRGTYTLDEVAHSLESARTKGLPVVLALENLVLQGGGSLRGPAEAAVHRRQGKLTNRKTYALASPLETIGEENQLRLFDGTTRKLLPPTRAFDNHPHQTDSATSAGSNVVQTLDLLTSACEALLKTSPRNSKGIESEEKSNSKTESRDSGVSSTGSDRGTYSLDDVSDSLKQAKDKGIPVVDALGSLTAPKPVKSLRIPRAIRKRGCKSDSNLSGKSVVKEDSSRQTYSLENVSSSMEAAKAKGIPVIAALDELTNSLAQFSVTGAKALKNGKKPIKKPERPSILRKREAARLERSGIKSEAGRHLERPMGMSFPISYPPAMRNSYSLDDVASAFETAYQTGASFQDVLDGKVTTSQKSSEDTSTTRSTGSLRTDDEKDQPLETKVIKQPTPSRIPSSSSDGQISSYLRKDSVSSEGSFSCSSSAGSAKDLSSSEDLVGGKVTRKQRKHSNGPFQLRRTRRNKPSNRKLNVSPSSSHGDSVESVTSLGSESSESDTNLTKRGTYDLKKVSEELDDLKIQGVSIVKSLDKLNTGNNLNTPSSKDHTPKRGTYSLEDISQHLDDERNEGCPVFKSLESLSKSSEVRKSIDSGVITEDSQLQSRDVINILHGVESPPKRGTYSLDDISQKIDSSASEGMAVNKALLELSQDNVANDKSTRNTFTLNHVELSIEDANKRGVPVVDVLDELSKSDSHQSNQKTQNTKPKRKPFVKPKWKGSSQDEFFIEYFPPKTESKSTNFDLENIKGTEGECVKYQKHDIEEDNLSKMNEIAKEGFQASELQMLEESSLGMSSTLEQKEENTNSTPLNADSISAEEKVGIVEKRDMESPSSASTVDTSLIDPQASDPSRAARPTDPQTTRRRWQRSGSYVEALDSFEEMLKSEQDVPKEITILTCPNEQDQSDEISFKESPYQSGTYEVMLPETTSVGRSTWRPSGSVLEQILSLMDDAEDKGLSIADALEQAADMSEQQGEIEESINNDTEDDTANPQHLALLRLQFEEKRRQIEAEKRRSQEQWEEERRRLGETAFWYTIGRAQSGDKDAYNIRPGHERVPTHEPSSPGQPTPPIGRSTPLESMSPLQTKPSYQSSTLEGYQSPRGELVHNQPTIGHGYHQTHFHRPGHQSPAPSGYHSPAQSGYQSPVASLPGFQFPSQSPASDFQQGLQSNGHEQEYETHEFRLSEHQVHTQQNASPLKSSPHQNGPLKSPSRKCWDINPGIPPSPTEALTPSSSEGRAPHVEELGEKLGSVGNQYDDAFDAQSKKGVAMFIGEESEKPKEGLTPEQQKKRERFLRSRQKKQEEEKARKDAENEKKKLRELKQKEAEEQKKEREEVHREEQQRRMKLSRERLAPSNSGESTYRPAPGANQQEDHSAFAEFSGPRCYVKPSGKSNRKLISNAISYVCLSGTVNKENKDKCLQAMADSPGFHFIVLFKDGLKFRGLYMLNPETEQGFKVFGIGPKVISSKMVDFVYKYSSGGKEFVKIPSKTLSISVDGVAIQKSYWQSNKPNVASKTQSNLKRPPRPPQR